VHKYAAESAVLFFGFTEEDMACLERTGRQQLLL
jgi:hypothetical protein